MNTPTINIYNEDCMDALAKMPDNAFDLAIVDPPYGIGRSGQKKSTSSHGGRKPFVFKGWDKSIPKSIYFKNLLRVSKNQIIWGANYFAKFLPSKMGWIVWDKGQRITQSDGELAFSSFDKALRIYTKNRAVLQAEGGTIHPTQKPVALYKWLLKNYAKEGDKILDTHLGSGSIAIACHDMGFDLEGYELDKEYFDGAMKRLNDHRKQLKLFI